MCFKTAINKCNSNLMVSVTSGWQVEWYGWKANILHSLDIVDSISCAFSFNKMALLTLLKY